MKQYYIPYDEKSSANYLFIFALYTISRVAKRGRERCVKYKSVKEIEEKITEAFNEKIIASSTIDRLLNDKSYSMYFVVDKTKKTITLNNVISKGRSRKFVVVYDYAAERLVKLKDNFLISYYLMIKYYCGYNKEKQIDTTAKQFLELIGKCASSGSLQSKLSAYNSILTDLNLISISKYRDEQSHIRNIYKVIF